MDTTSNTENNDKQQEMVLLAIGIALILIGCFALYKIALWLYQYMLFQWNELQSWWQHRGGKRYREDQYEQGYSDEDEEHYSQDEMDPEEEEEEQVIVVKKKRGPKKTVSKRKRTKVRYEYE